MFRYWKVLIFFVLFRNVLYGLKWERKPICTCFVGARGALWGEVGDSGGKWVIKGSVGVENWENFRRFHRLNSRVFRKLGKTLRYMGNLCRFLRNMRGWTPHFVPRRRLRARGALPLSVVFAGLVEGAAVVRGWVSILGEVVLRGIFVLSSVCVSSLRWAVG